MTADNTIKPVAWVTRGTKRAHVLWIGDNEQRIPWGTRLYAGPGPHMPSEMEAVELTRCCGRSECGGECGNVWSGMEWVAVRRESDASAERIEALRVEVERAEAEAAAAVERADHLEAGVNEALREIEDAGPKALKYAAQELRAAIARAGGEAG